MLIVLKHVGTVSQQKLNLDQFQKNQSRFKKKNPKNKNSTICTRNFKENAGFTLCIDLHFTTVWSCAPKACVKRLGVLSRSYWWYPQEARPSSRALEYWENGPGSNTESCLLATLQ